MDVNPFSYANPLVFSVTFAGQHHMHRHIEPQTWGVSTANRKPDLHRKLDLISTNQGHILTPSCLK